MSWVTHWFPTDPDEREPMSQTTASAFAEDAAATAPLDPEEFRSVLGHYPTGVALVTAVGADGEPIGMIVGSFTSVSLDPPLVAYLPMKSSSTFARLRGAESFCVNVLGADQEDSCRTFARRGENKFAGVSWRPAPSGAPILDGAVAWIDCTQHSVTEAGDHYIVLGEVTSLGVEKPAAPLLFFQGGYGRFTPQSLVAPSEADLIAAVHLAELARGAMEGLAGRVGAECSALASVSGDLVHVANAAAPDVIGSQVGQRIPLMPPLGELYVAWEGEEVAEEWLAKAAAVDDCSRETYEERLAMARERGWSMSLAGNYREKELFHALRSYTEGRYTPAEERRIREVVAGASRYYDPVPIVADQTYDVASLVAPVLGGDGHVELVLRLAKLPQGVSGTVVQTWIDDLVATAAAVGRKVASA